MATAVATNSIYGRDFRSSTAAAQIDRAQTGPIVITNGRIVSLAELEFRSKASKTNTLP